jgi:antitoxin component of MazEF toxin-antitoxin module
MADRKISDLTALTTPASGDYLPIVDISETAASSKNKRITIEELFRGVPLGTAAAPSIAIEGDENTGIYSPGADQLAISTNGTGRLFVDSSGNVGVGSVPSSALDVNGVITVRNGGAIRGLIGAPAGDPSYISLQNGALANSFVNSAINQNLTGFTTVNAAPGQQLALRIGNGDAILIDSSKRVGIGTAAPSSALDVNGVITVRNSGAIRGLIGAVAGDPNYISLQNGALADSFANSAINQNTSGFTVVNAAPGQQLALRIGNDEAIRIDSSKRVGIGTTSPGCELEIGGNGHIHLANQGRVGCNSGSGEPNDAYVKFYDSDIIGFHTTDIERARIDSSGRLLVGTSTDSGGALLQVNGDRVRIATAKTPASATATGTTGEVCWDADYIYVCTATNTWKRTAISTWP